MGLFYLWCKPESFAINTFTLTIDLRALWTLLGIFFLLKDLLKELDLHFLYDHAIIKQSGHGNFWYWIGHFNWIFLIHYQIQSRDAIRNMMYISLNSLQYILSPNSKENYSR